MVFCELKAMNRPEQILRLILLKVLILMLFIPSNVSADGLFSLEDLHAIAAILAADNCQEPCTTEKWTIRHIAFSSNEYQQAHPEESLYLVIDDRRANWCGSAGCPGAYLLKDSTRLVLLKEGFGVGTSDDLQPANILCAGLRKGLIGVSIPQQNID